MKNQNTLRAQLLILLFLFFAAPAAHALTPEAPKGSFAGRWKDYDRSQYFGVRLGVNLPALYFRGMGGVPTETLTGLRVGAVYGIQLTNELPLFVELGLNYSEKGARVEGNFAREQIDYKMRYLDLPFVLKYKFDLGADDFTLQPFFGGYAAMGVAGKARYYHSREKLSTFRHNLFNVFDCGFRMGCGAAYRNFYLELSYEVGMTNVAHSDFRDLDYDDFDDNIRTGNLSVSVGLDF